MRVQLRHEHPLCALFGSAARIMPRTQIIVSSLGDEMGHGVYWIDTPTAARLATMSRPRAGEWLDDEIAGWRREGIGVVVSLLEADEVRELGLHREAGICGEHMMEFISFPISDRGVPASLHKAMALARLMVLRIGEGKAVAVHCRAGIGRSSLVAACVLVCSGFDTNTAFEMIGKARGMTVPDTGAQRDWVTAFQEAILLDAKY
jgi:protein-tyrosine phosphatase